MGKTDHEYGSQKRRAVRYWDISFHLIDPTKPAAGNTPDPM